MNKLWLPVFATLLASPAFAGGMRLQPDPGAPTWNNPPPAGVETLQPAAPTWCPASYKPRPWSGANEAYDDVKRLGYSEELLKEIGQLACDRPNDPARQAWIAFYRQGWLNIVGTTDAEDRQAMAARMAADVRRQDPACAALRSDDDAVPEQRVFQNMRAEILGCAGPPSAIGYGTDGGASRGAMSYWVDSAVEPPDELVRLSFVMHCLNPGSNNLNPKEAHLGLGNYAFCGHDVRKLDRGAFDRALEAMHPSALQKARAREMFAYTKLLLADYDRNWKALAAKDKDYTKIAYDLPEQGFAAWLKQREANKAALDAAFAMEATYHEGDKRAVAGCGTSLRKQLKEHVHALAPKTKEDVIAAANDDVGQPILRALIACDSLEQRHGLVDSEFKLLGQGRLRRGPRTAAFWYTLDAVADIAKDKPPKFLAQPKVFGAPLPHIRPELDWMHLAYEATFNQTSFDRDQVGRVASVKPQGDGVVVTFRTESWQEPTLDCRETNRIDRIEPDGKIIYRENCVETGTHTESSTPSPAWIRKDLADGIAPGVYLEMRRDIKPSPAQGFPLAVYSDAKKKHLVQTSGFAVR